MKELRFNFYLSSFFLDEIRTIQDVFGHLIKLKNIIWAKKSAPQRLLHHETSQLKTKEAENLVEMFLT
jgi:hypothetical protein